MKKLICMGFTFLFVSILFFPLANAEMKAVLIGNMYSDAERPLNGTHNDVNLIAGTLAGMGYDTNSSFDIGKGEILKAISGSLSGSVDNDVSIFYFSGHGTVDRYEVIEGRPYVEGEGKIVPEARKVFYDDSIVKEGISYTDIFDRSGNPIKYDEIFRELDRVKGKKIIILDNCFSGSIIEYVGKSKNPDDYFILTASASSEVALELDGYGIFTFIVCEVLNAKNVYTFQELSQEVQRRYAEWIEAHYFQNRADYVPVIQSYPQSKDLLVTHDKERLTYESTYQKAPVIYEKWGDVLIDSWNSEHNSPNQIEGGYWYAVDDPSENGVKTYIPGGMLCTEIYDHFDPTGRYRKGDDWETSEEKWAHNEIRYDCFSSEDAEFYEGLLVECAMSTVQIFYPDMTPVELIALRLDMISTLEKVIQSKTPRRNGVAVNFGAGQLFVYYDSSRPTACIAVK